MSKKEQKMLVRICISLFFLLLLIIAEHTNVLSFIKNMHIRTILCLSIALIGYLVAGYDVLLKAAKNISHGQVFDESFLMMIATFGAFFIDENVEAVAVMVFYQVGELFQNIAVGKSRASIKQMMEIVPEYANLLKDGQMQKVDPDDVSVGDSIVILPGERIPLDGIVLDGASFVDTSSLTGESVPRSIHQGDSVVSGCINQTSNLIIRVTADFENSTVTKILELVENASTKKAHVENFITRFAHFYTPCVTIAAVLLALIPPLLFQENWSEWIRRACTFLVISCPCALVISVPLGFFGGIGAASKLGVLVKGSNYLELLSKVKVMVFDKTGTLTKGTFSVTACHPSNDPEREAVSTDDLKRIAAHLESFSNHPIALALQKAYEGPIDLNNVANFEEISGKGITATFNKTTYILGNEKLMADHRISVQQPQETGTIIYLASETAFLGAFVISDEIKENAKEALQDLQETGVEETVLLTGDHQKVAEDVQKKLHLTRIFADLLPQDKVTKLEELLSPKTTVAFVGDGINDAPVLMRADLGIAMGSLGSDAAIEAADIVLMDDDLSKIAKTVKIAEKTLRIVRENIIVSLTVKFLVLLLGALGIASMWLALFADVGVMIIAVMNSTRMVFMRAE